MELYCRELETTTLAQGQNRLRIGDDYCCLGIACNLYQKATGKGAWVKSGFVIGAFDFKIPTEKYPDSFYTETNYMPGPVHEWLGLNWRDIQVGMNEGMDDFSGSRLNDKVGFTFKQIAVAIRKVYLS